MIILMDGTLENEFEVPFGFMFYGMEKMSKEVSKVYDIHSTKLKFKYAKYCNEEFVLDAPFTFNGNLSKILGLYRQLPYEVSKLE